MKGQSDIIEEALIFAIAFSITMVLILYMERISSGFLSKTSELVVKSNGERIMNYATKAIVAGAGSSFVVYVEPSVESRSYAFVTSDGFRVVFRGENYSIPVFMADAYGISLNEYSSGKEFFVTNDGTVRLKRFNPLDYGLS